MPNLNYAIGRIKALETRMLSEEKILRMISAEDFSSAFVILNESIYAEHLSKLSSPFDFEELLIFELQAIKDLFFSLAPDNEILNSLWLKYDFENIKTLLKIKFCPISYLLGPRSLAKVGILEVDFLKNFILENMGKIEKVTEELAQLLTRSMEEAKKIYEETADPQMIDLTLDRNYYHYLWKSAEKSAVPFFKKLVHTKIDLLNLKIWFRIKSLDKDIELLKKALLSGGIIEVNLWLELFEKSFEDLALRLKFSPYGKILSEGIFSLSILEKLVDNLFISEFKKAKYFAFGIEPLIGFFLAKEQEISTLRFILVGKKNFVPIEKLKERLRESYG